MMDALPQIGGILWTTVFATAWLLLGAFHLWSLRTGCILGITAGPRAIKRNERPVRFWLAWFALAWPFVVLPLLVIAGLLLNRSAV